MKIYFLNFCKWEDSLSPFNEMQICFHFKLFPNALKAMVRSLSHLCEYEVRYDHSEFFTIEL